MEHMAPKGHKHPHHRDGKESLSHIENDTLVHKKGHGKHQVVKDSMHGTSHESKHVKTNVKGSRD